MLLCAQLLLDEPTNHLDIEAIDSLAAAIKGYKGGLVVRLLPLTCLHAAFRLLAWLLLLPLIAYAQRTAAPFVCVCACQCHVQGFSVQGFRVHQCSFHVQWLAELRCVCLQLVSHDFRLIDQVAEEIWVCDKKKVTIWKVHAI